ncbi:MarR family transcriptional regulator [Mycolicibacterium sp. P1-18]|uniref:MarR family winged helix-turn-helix transcriptional regulator n=1 Tax=Mycolicibacterium sp. P1-18 TaxID=2024615 RepID=UPI0011F26263|nr:MarR family transcriptional regulator [Mycolicibacterium sp. P1-18]KAA0101050.1 MarR family transcriptional regulator [Mycolicibacterium sp. P1-18]
MTAAREALSAGAAYPSDDQVDAILRASRALVGIAAASMADVVDTITVPQFRVLVMLSGRGPLNLGAVAENLNVNPSNASRTCDRLVKANLVCRSESDADRRLVLLSLTPGGRRLVGKVTRRRRAAIRRVLLSMGDEDRDAVAAALASFADAAGEVDEGDALGLFWPTS